MVVIIVNILFNIFTVIKELPNLYVIVRLSERWETGGEGNSECGRIDVYSPDQSTSCCDELILVHTM